MELIILKTAEDAAGLTARIMADELRRNPKTVFGLATGRTMELVYDLLAVMHKEDGLDFSHSRTFNLDEYEGLSPDDEQSYRYYMNQRLFKRVNIDIKNTHLPDGSAGDIDAECLAYESAIEDAGGIDLQLLGIGRNGHIGFNEPLSSFRSRTRAVALSPDTIAQNAPNFESPERMPRRAMTMGIGTILDSRRCLLLATGSGKAGIIAKAIEGPVTSMISATALQFHNHCTIILDEAAGAELKSKDYQ